MLTVLKIGGKVVDDPQALQGLLTDFSGLSGPKVLVHGGGRSATAMAARLGIEARMLAGRRITDAEMLKIVVMVFGGWVNKQIVARLQALGVNACGFTGADLNLIRARKRPPQPIDYGFVGDVESVQHEVLQQLLEQGILPVIAPLTHDGQGQLLNTNADTTASVVAAGLARHGPVRLVLCFEMPGVLRDPGDPASVIPLIRRPAYEQLKAAGIISAGMIPKLDNAFDALDAGVQEVCICDRSGLNSLEGNFSGTRVLAD